jgi:hypothetical protein
MADAPLAARAAVALLLLPSRCTDRQGTRWVGCFDARVLSSRGGLAASRGCAPCTMLPPGPNWRELFLSPLDCRAQRASTAEDGPFSDKGPFRHGQLAGSASSLTLISPLDSKLVCMIGRIMVALGWTDLLLCLCLCLCLDVPVPDRRLECS